MYFRCDLTIKTNITPHNQSPGRIQTALCLVCTALSSGICMDLEIEKKLESMRAEYEALPIQEIIDLDWKDLPPLTIGKTTYNSSVWSYKRDYIYTLVVQLKTEKNIIGVYKEYALGAYITEDGTIEHLSQEELWNNGIT